MNRNVKRIKKQKMGRRKYRCYFFSPIFRGRSVKCILRWALGWKDLFPPTWEPIHGQFETVGREGRVLVLGTC